MFYLKPNGGPPPLGPREFMMVIRLMLYAYGTYFILEAAGICAWNIWSVLASPLHH